MFRQVTAEGVVKAGEVDVGGAAPRVWCQAHGVCPRAGRRGGVRELRVRTGGWSSGITVGRSIGCFDHHDRTEAVLGIVYAIEIDTAGGGGRGGGARPGCERTVASAAAVAADVDPLVTQDARPPSAVVVAALPGHPGGRPRDAVGGVCPCRRRPPVGPRHGRPRAGAPLARQSSTTSGWSATDRPPRRGRQPAPQTGPGRRGGRPPCGWPTRAAASARVPPCRVRRPRCPRRRRVQHGGLHRLRCRAAGGGVSVRTGTK